MTGPLSHGDPHRAARLAFRGLALLLGGLLASGSALAQSEKPSGGPEVIRDAEIEQLMREYTTPIFRAAGINGNAAKVILVGDRSFNAFVANGQKIFINVGALMESKSPNEVIGVLAHESGHIAGGHLTRQRQELARAQIMAVAGMLMGAAAIHHGEETIVEVGTDNDAAPRMRFTVLHRKTGFFLAKLEIPPEE